jgi:hypothetical protein
MKKFLNKETLNQEFQDFLKKEKLSFFNFFIIYGGAIMTCFLLGSYLETLSFTSFFSIGNLLLLWAGWLVLSFLLSAKEEFKRVILWLNNLWLVVSFFYLAILSSSAWIMILLAYIVFALILINFMQSNFLPAIDSLGLGGLGAIGLLCFYFKHKSLFEFDGSALLNFLLIAILIVSGAAFFAWNGGRSRRALRRIYDQRQELEETALVLEIRIKAKTKELQEQSALLREENQLKTNALRRRIDELERFRRMVVGRELKMVELKEKLAQLKKDRGELKEDSV